MRKEPLKIIKLPSHDWLRKTKRLRVAAPGPTKSAPTVLMRDRFENNGGYAA